MTLQYQFTLVSDAYSYVGDTITWRMQATNLGTDTKIVDFDFHEPYVMVAADITTGTPVLSGGATSAGNRHTLPNGGKVIVDYTAIAPNRDQCNLRAILQTTVVETVPVQVRAVPLATVTLNNPVKHYHNSEVVRLNHYSDRDLEVYADMGDTIFDEWLERFDNPVTEARMADARDSGIDYASFIGTGTGSATPGATSFSALTDTPNSLAGLALQVLRVNAASSAVEAVQLAAAITSFDNTTAAIAGNPANVQAAIEALKALTDNLPNQLQAADIAARDALGAQPNSTIVHVADASADPGVTAGWAKYQYLGGGWEFYLSQEDISIVALTLAQVLDGADTQTGTVSGQQLNELVGIRKWQGTVAYAAGDLVSHSGVIYRNIAANTGTAPPNPGIWLELAPDPLTVAELTNRTSTAEGLVSPANLDAVVGVKNYLATNDYAPGEHVSHGGRIWTAVAAHNSAAPVTPGTNPAVWDPVGANELALAQLQAGTDAAEGTVSAANVHAINGMQLWNNVRSYQLNELVTHAGLVYRAKQVNTAQTPTVATNADWEVMWHLPIGTATNDGQIVRYVAATNTWAIGDEYGYRFGSAVSGNLTAAFENWYAASGTGYTVTLPADAVGTTGRVRIENAALTGPITIAVAAGESLNGTPDDTFSMPLHFGSVSAVKTGAGSWRVYREDPPESLQSWQAGVTYASGDLVERNGMLWTAQTGTTNNDPTGDDGTNWKLHRLAGWFDPKGNLVANTAPIWGGLYVADTTGGSFAIPAPAIDQLGGRIRIMVIGNGQVTVTGVVGAPQVLEGAGTTYDLVDAGAAGVYVTKTSAIDQRTVALSPDNKPVVNVARLVTAATTLDLADVPAEAGHNYFIELAPNTVLTVPGITDPISHTGPNNEIVHLVSTGTASEVRIMGNSAAANTPVVAGAFSHFFTGSAEQQTFTPAETGTYRKVDRLGSTNNNCYVNVGTTAGADQIFNGGSNRLSNANGPTLTHVRVAEFALTAGTTYHLTQYWGGGTSYGTCYTTIERVA